MQQATQEVRDSTTHELIAEWKVWMEVSRGLLPNTMRLYSKTLERAHQDLGELVYLPSETLEAWIQQRGGRSSSVSNRICALTSFYRFLVKTKKRPDNPAAELDRPRRHKGVPKPVRNLEEALETLDRYDRRVDGRRVGETRDMAVFIAETGLRISEACSIHLDEKAPESVTIIGKGHKEAIVLLTDKARQALDRLSGEIGIGPRAVQRRFERADFHPHQLRHWRATSLVQNGVEIGTVSKIMRHSSPAITMVYAEYAQGQMRDALNQVP